METRTPAEPPAPAQPSGPVSELALSRAEAADPDDWAPSIEAASEAITAAGVPFWIAGGVAIDLFLGYPSRDHHDVDIAVLRRDLERIEKALLPKWSLMIPVGWVGEPDKSHALFLPYEERDLLTERFGQIWCRPRAGGSFVFELLLNDAEEEVWIFKKDASIRLPLEEFGVVPADGLPYLRPEVVLLHKATSSFFGPHADEDFANAAPRLSLGKLAWLQRCLERLRPGHHWLPELRRIASEPLERDPTPNG